MDKSKQRVLNRKRRARRVRVKVAGNQTRPRLCVSRSLKHIRAQIINDGIGGTIVQISSTAKEILEKAGLEKKKTKTDIARMVGEIIAEKAIQIGIKQVVFDRAGYPYHGRIKALADAARSKGLVF